MSEENKKHEYRFITDDSFSVVKTISLNAGLNQIWECLISEGVPIHPSSIVKCMDMYLRLIGLCKGSNDEFPPINILFSPVEFKELFYDDDTNDQKIEIVKNLFDLINECLDDDRKFKPSELDVIKSGDNVKTIFKEIAALFNDIINRLIEEYSTDNTVYVVATTTIKLGDGKESASFEMDISYSGIANAVAVSVQSNILVKSDGSNAIGIAIDTFPPEVQERINKAMPETEEK